MATGSVSTEKPIRNYTHTSSTQHVNNHVPMIQSLSLKRQPVSGLDESSDVTTHQNWIQEYHKSKQEPQLSQLVHQQSKVTNGYKVLSPRLSEQEPRVTMNGTSARFDALQINTSSDIAQTHGETEPDMSLKRNKTELLDGYKVYRGITPVSRRKKQEVNPSTPLGSTDSPKFVVSNVVASNEHGRRTSLHSFYYPDKLMISKHVWKDNHSPRQSIAQYNNMARGYSFPLRNHVRIRPRPQSATVAVSPQASGDKVKGSSTSKQTVRKGRQAMHIAPKTSTLKQSHISKVVDSCNAQQRDSLILSPRQLGTLPRPSYKLDVNVGLKSELQPQPKAQHQNQNCQTPKSILKNNSCVETNACLAIRPFRADHALSMETPCGKISPYLLPSDFSLNDYMLSPREVNRRYPAMSERSPPSPSHVNYAATRTMVGPKRPMSAVPSPSKYELDDSHSTGRKSVTFNSYVSLMTGNRVSTIRSLSVDV